MHSVCQNLTWAYEERSSLKLLVNHTIEDFDIVAVLIYCTCTAVLQQVQPMCIAVSSKQDERLMKALKDIGNASHQATEQPLRKD